VLYHFLTGRPPFQGESTFDLALEKERGIFPPAHRLNLAVPRRLDLILDKMLARQPRLRYQDCHELLAHLASLGPAQERLSLRALPGGQSAAAATLTPIPQREVRVLLVADDPAIVLLAQEVAQTSDRTLRLSFVPNGIEALTFLRRQGPHAAAPRPQAIILARPLTAAGSLPLAAALQPVRGRLLLPLILLDGTSDDEKLLARHGLRVSLYVRRPGTPEQFERLSRSLRALVTHPPAGGQGPGGADSSS
jgi:chemotaxis family two-component system response regulator Rcp1